MIPELQMYQGKKIKVGQVWRNHLSPAFTMALTGVDETVVTWDGLFGGDYKTPLAIFENWTRCGSDWYLTNPEGEDGGRNQGGPEAAEDGPGVEGDGRPG